MKEGAIVITSLVQANGRFKLRPSVLFKKLPPYNDCLLCGISTQLHHFVSGFDEMLNQAHPDFGISKLYQPSIIRLGFLTIQPESRIMGATGYISETTHRKLLRRLAEYLLKDNP